MKYINNIYAIVLVLALSIAGCDKAGDPGTGDDMQQIEGIVLGLGAVIEAPAQATTRATVNSVDYAVNTLEDPTNTKNTENRITGRNAWRLDFDLFNGNVTDKYGPGSFTGATSPDGLNWKPTPGDLYFPNYFRPWAAVWLYHTTRDATVATDQSDAAKLLAQDQLYRLKNQLDPIAKRITLQLEHQRAMINFRFDDIVRGDINESTVRVSVGGTEYIPFSVRATGTLEYMLILPEDTPASSKIIVEYKTNGNTLQQPINYKQTVSLTGAGPSGTLGSNNCYCFTLSGKELKISPVIIINWITGEPVAGEYVAVTAYPTFKGPKDSTYYFYYDNKLTSGDGNPVLQEINFNNDGECTIKPDGRIITHIFKEPNPTEDWNLYKLTNPITLGNTGKMYIDLETIINNLYS